ncbi:MAG: dTDP-glucose 4,6-dehydratase [Candidatus Marinimicrobia bacterium]|nr:dTDP-glucose 4,6-dehydratase [Candidatus Neomarinimicrobiota bacterium]|tara:strand:+ start:4554 stop:5603 length:1050 start_codon:yes stop_codon:yes gene_type:complete
MKILVFGGSGFIGSNFINYCFKNDNYIILNVDSLTYASSNNSILKNDNYNFIKGDICNQYLINKIIIDFKPDFIINFAAESHVDRSIDNPIKFIETNVLGVANLLNESLNYYRTLELSQKNKFKFLHISTDEVYGSLSFNENKFSETTPYNPSSPYSASKASSDHLVRAWNKTYNLPVLITNCSNNYGPFQFPEKLIPLMIIKCFHEQKLPIYGDGKNIRDWIYVEDHCSAILKVLKKGKVGETYNIGSNCEKSNLDIVNEICLIMDKFKPRKNGTKYKELVTFVKDRPGHDLRYAIDSSKIKEHVNWESSISFEEGIVETVQWYIDNVEWWSEKINSDYNLSRLGVDK